MPQPPFAFIVTRRPLSGSAGGRQRYQDYLAAKAKEAYKNREPMDGRLYTRVIWFTRDARTGDIDNILKGIFDALKTVVYKDDDKVVKCVVSKIEITDSYEIDERLSRPEIVDELTVLLGQAWRDILYVEVGKLTEQRVVFGPPDGDAL